MKKEKFIQLLKDPEIEDLLKNFIKQALYEMKNLLLTDVTTSMPVLDPQSSLQTENKCMEIENTDSLREAFENDLVLLKLVIEDTELCNVWLQLRLPFNEGRALRRLLVIAGQWERILDLWDFLAKRCKREQRRITPQELQLLECSLSIHNLSWSEKIAYLYSPELNSPFDYTKHDRVSLKGDYIIEACLPGLINAGGSMQKKPLVKTE